MTLLSRGHLCLLSRNLISPGLCHAELFTPHIISSCSAGHFLQALTNNHTWDLVRRNGASKAFVPLDPRSAPLGYWSFGSCGVCSSYTQESLNQPDRMILRNVDYYHGTHPRASESLMKTVWRQGMYDVYIYASSDSIEGGHSNL